MKSRTVFALGIAFGYLICRERYDIRNYKKQIKELEKDKEVLIRYMSGGNGNYVDDRRAMDLFDNYVAE